MKNRRLAALIAALVMTLTGCGKVTDDTSDSKMSSAAEASSIAESSEPADSSEADSEQTGEPDGDKKPAHASVGENGAKAVSDVLLIPHDNIDISRDVSFSDLYGRHALHSGVVGLVGAPVDVQFDPDEVKGGKLVFVYDPDELKGVRPDALMFMWYDESNDCYVELDKGVLNTENCSMSIEIDKPGVYLLVNMYTWLNVWGAGLADDGMEEGYDPAQRPIDGDMWKKHESVGDIPQLADEQYIRSCRQDEGGYKFEVANAEQLASAVYFVNCANEDGQYTVVIELTDDIDLAGYAWAPMGWSAAGVEYDFMGAVIGNGHTIKNMTINTTSYAGFIGKGTNCLVSELNFENAYVSGREPGIVIGYARGSYITGCSVQGEVRGSDAGSVIGRDQSSGMVECTASVTCDGEDISEFLSGTDRAIAEVMKNHEITETIWLDENDRPTREAGLEDEYSNIGWRVMRDGVQILDRSAKNETSFSWQDYPLTSGPGHYEITLTAYIDGYYIPISNTVSYDVEWQQEW